MRHSFKVSFMVLLGLFLLSFGKTHNPVSLVSSRDGEIVLEFQLPEYSITQVRINGKNCSKIAVPFADISLEKGYPELPYFSQNIVIPIDAEDVTVEQIGQRIVKVAVAQVIPSKGSLTRNIRPSTVPYEFSDFYTTNQWYPNQTTELSKPFFQRDVRGITIYFNPFQYNPSTGIVKIYKTISVKISAKGTQYYAGSYTGSKQGISPSFEGLYRQRYINYKIERSRFPKVEDGVNMMIISPPKFKETLKPYIEWRNQIGINTKLYLYPDETQGSGIAALETFIKAKTAEENITYVLFVGDENDVPATAVQDYSGRGKGIKDPLYTLVKGDDEYPDIFHGRWWAAEESLIKNAMNKVLTYEKEVDVESDWYGKTFGMASIEGSPPSDKEWCQQSLKILSDYGYSIDSAYHDNTNKITTEKVSTPINTGVGFFLHLGHGSATAFGMNEPSSFYFEKNDIVALKNGNKVPFFFQLACNNGSGVGADCVGEMLTTRENFGGLNVVGCAIQLDWVPPQHSQLGMVNGIVSEEYLSTGAIFWNAESYMLEKDKTAKKTFETYCLFGDPSVLFFTKKPNKINVTHKGSIAKTAKEFKVTVDSKIDGRVCLYSDSKGIVSSAMVKEADALTLNIDAIPSDDIELLLTVTGRNVKPYQKKVLINNTDIVTSLGLPCNSMKFSVVSGKNSICTPIVLNTVNFDNVLIVIYDIKGKSIYTSSTLKPINLHSKTGSILASGRYLAKVTTYIKSELVNTYTSQILITR